MDTIDTELKKNQYNQSGKGGRREGAGRPVGSSKKPKITDYMNQELIDEYVQLYLSQCREKPDLMKHLMEQIFGKAIQQTELTGKDGEAITMNLVQYGDYNPISIQSPKLPNSDIPGN